MVSPMRIESRFSKEGREALKSRNEILLLGLLAAGIAWAGGPGAAPAGGEETWMTGPGQTLMASTTTSAPNAGHSSVASTSQSACRLITQAEIKAVQGEAPIEMKDS